MSPVVQINEIVSGPLISFPQLPPVNIQIGPEAVSDIPLGSSFGDAHLGSSNGDQVLGSSGLTLPSIPTIPGPGSWGSLTPFRPDGRRIHSPPVSLSPPAAPRRDLRE
jgi:hypothetical protein